jgi:hypothetical protein
MKLITRLAATFLATWLLATGAHAAEFAWSTDAEKGTADLKFGDHVALRYHFAYDPSTPERLHDTYKVFHHVFGPGTDVPITKGPGGHYTHHRGLYVGWNKTKFDGGQADFWHCTNGAHQRHVEFVEQRAYADRGTMTALIHWNDSDGKPVIVESRTVVVRTLPTDFPPNFGWQIDWSARLESRRGEITLDGDRQHAGFQFRAANVVAEKNSARFLRPAGFPDQPQAFEVSDATDPDKHVDLGWFVMTYDVDDKPYSVGYFEDPALPKPSRYSERPYGRFGAFFATTLTPDRPLTLRYRVVVTTEPAASRDVWQQRYDAFVQDLKSAPR